MAVVAAAGDCSSNGSSSGSSQDLHSFTLVVVFA
jgi:hypothetical protein